MLRFTPFCMWLVALFLVVPWTFAAPVGVETFEGLTVGSLGGQGSGTGWNAAWSTQATGQAVVDTSGSPLSYTFSEGNVVSGGTRALEYGGLNNDNLIRRQLSSPFSGDELYVSFLIQRTGGSNESPSDGSVSDFAIWWLDNTSGGVHGNDLPNIGIYDESTALNQVVARFSSAEQTHWAEGSPVDALVNPQFVVGRLSKGNDATNPSDFDGWDLWVFDSNAAPRSIEDLLTPDDTGARASNRTALDWVGVRTVILETDDRFTIDEWKMGTKLGDVAPTVYETTAGEINGAHALDFESVAAPTTIAGDDELFTRFGITQVSANAADGGDYQNQSGRTGNSLFADADELFVLPEADTTTSFGETTSFTIDLDRKHTSFGVSFQDQAGAPFTLTLFDGGEQVGSYTKSLSDLTTAPIIVTSLFEFDRVVVSGGNSGDGWGIDNLLLASVREIALDDFTMPTVLDFESVAAPTTIAGNDPLFRDFGVAVSATGGSQSGDYSSVNNANDQALYFNGTDLLVLPDVAGSGFTPTDWYFGAGQEFTLDFEHDHSRFGIVFADQGQATFEFTFFLDGQHQAVFLRDVPNVNADTLYFETGFLFDRVVIGSLGTDGFGIDNITIEHIPEPTTALLACLGLVALAFLRRRKR